MDEDDFLHPPQPNQLLTLNMPRGGGGPPPISPGEPSIEDSHLLADRLTDPVEKSAANLMGIFPDSTDNLPTPTPPPQAVKLPLQEDSQTARDSSILGSGGPEIPLSSENKGGLLSPPSNLLDLPHPPNTSPTPPAHPPTPTPLSSVGSGSQPDETAANVNGHQDDELGKIMDDSTKGVKNESSNESGNAQQPPPSSLLPNKSNTTDEGKQLSPGEQSNSETIPRIVEGSPQSAAVRFQGSDVSQLDFKNWLHENAIEDEEPTDLYSQVETSIQKMAQLQQTDKQQDTVKYLTPSEDDTSSMLQSHGNSLKDLSASRVEEAALDDKLGLELLGIVEQIQAMQKELAEALKE